MLDISRQHVCSELYAYSYLLSVLKVKLKVLVLFIFTLLCSVVVNKWAKRGSEFPNPNRTCRARILSAASSIDRTEDRVQTRLPRV